jgi:hypothetical protein
MTWKETEAYKNLIKQRQAGRPLWLKITEWCDCDGPTAAKIAKRIIEERREYTEERVCELAKHYMEEML